MKITVVGTGYVGLVTGSYFANKGIEVVNLDILPEKITALQKGEIPFYEPGLHDFVKEAIRLGKLTFTTDYKIALKDVDVIFICVGTPSKNSKADLSFIESATISIAENLTRDAIIVGKSTIPIGIKDWVVDLINKNKQPDVKIDWVVNPEFLSEGTAVFDMQNPSRVVIGGESSDSLEKVANLYSDLNCPIIKTDVESAILIKYASNSFLATKISFVNNLANIADKLDASITDVVYGLGLDPRIGNKFLKPGIGFGGSCFPKDITAFYTRAEELGLDFNLLKEVERINLLQSETIVTKIVSELGELKGKKITLLGLSFKPETDDLREAPSVKLVKSLLSKGARVFGHDPEALENFKKLNLEIDLSEDVYETCKKSDAIVLVTEWQFYLWLDWERIKSLVKKAFIVDGRNFLDKNKLKESGFLYKGVGVR